MSCNCDTRLDGDGDGADDGDDVDDDLDDARDDGDDDGDDLPFREVISPAESAPHRRLFFSVGFRHGAAAELRKTLLFLGFWMTRGIYARGGSRESSRGPRRPPGAARGGAAPGGRLDTLWPPSGCSFACLRYPSEKHPPSIFR